MTRHGGRSGARELAAMALLATALVASSCHPSNRVEMQVRVVSAKPLGRGDLLLAAKAMDERLDAMGRGSATANVTDAGIDVTVPDVGADSAEGQRLAAELVRPGRVLFRPLLDPPVRATEATLSPTDAANVAADREVVADAAPTADGAVLRFRLGPAAATQNAVVRTEVTSSGSTAGVTVRLAADDRARSLLDLRRACERSAPRCPATLPGANGQPIGSIALVLDAAVLAASLVDPSNGGAWQVASGLTGDLARSLGARLESPPLPAEFVVRRSTTVSVP